MLDNSRPKEHTWGTVWAEEVTMGRYVIVLVVPVIIGVLIAAAIVVIDGLRQRRIDQRLAADAVRHPEGPLAPADPPAADQSADVTHRRIAS